MGEISLEDAFFKPQVQYFIMFLKIFLVLVDHAKSYVLFTCSFMLDLGFVISRKDLLDIGENIRENMKHMIW